MRVLITGVNGFVGKHLTRELKQRGDEVIGIGRETDPAYEIKELLSDYWVCDLMDKEAVAKLALENIDAVISLAGLVKVGDSFAEPEKYKTVNVGVLVNLCQALVAKNIKPRIIAVSTGAVYDSAQPMPLSEQSGLTKDGSPYNLSKIAMEEAATQFSAQGLPCIIARPFNHIGPGQEAGFILPDLYAQIKEASSSSKTVKVGRLSTKRDYTDVRDVVRAYADLAHAKALKHDVYNIASGKSVAGREILDLLINSTSLMINPEQGAAASNGLSNLTGTNVKIEIDQSLMRPNDSPDLYGSYARLQAETGWRPKIALKQTIEDFVKAAA